MARMEPRTSPRREPRKQERRPVSLYLRLVNHRTGETVGDIGDISHEGFRLESAKAIPVNAVFTFRMDVPPDLLNKPFIIFNARSRWTRVDPLDSRLFDTGFEITAMDPSDGRAFELIFEKYGRQSRF